MFWFLIGICIGYFGKNNINQIIKLIKEKYF